MMLNKILILRPLDKPINHLKGLFRRYGYQVVEDVITDNMIEMTEEIEANLIILNAYHDEIESFHFCKELKKNSATKDVPIIVQLHHLSEDDKLAFIKLGIDDYIQAPYHDEELILKVKNQINVNQLRKKLQDSNNALEESLSRIANQKLELDRNLTMAAKIQEALIPKSLGNIPNCSFLWHFQPSGKVGGDMFDAFMLDEDHMGMYMIDVMGHGIASSMLAVALSESLIIDIDRGSPLKRKINESPYYEIISPIEVIRYLNKRFPFAKYKHYFTIFYMVLNVKTGVLKYVRAAHPAPFLIKTTGEIQELDGYGTPIGFEFAEDYEEKTVCLDNGDAIVVYTDGLLEIKDEAGKILEYDGLVSFLKEEIKWETHHYSLNLKKLSRNQQKLKDDLSIFEMKWIKFV